MNITLDDVNALCTQLAQDPLLVQGAGGNVSWKDNGTLWVKSSGSWLAKSEVENIFVPVDYAHLRKSLSEYDFHAAPKVLAEESLRPSIETCLHALMPQKIVVHLHAVDALRYLVLVDWQEKLRGLFDRQKHKLLKLGFVGYSKPGPDLARAMCSMLQESQGVNLALLKNHGIVLGANSIHEVKQIINLFLEVCRANEKSNVGCPLLKLPEFQLGSHYDYRPVADIKLQQLALNPKLFDRLSKEWALYPDHVVFLGKFPQVFSSWESFFGNKFFNNQKPELIFIREEGVFVRPSFNLAKNAQLRCYFDVISRLDDDVNLDPLSELSINELLNWDAEAYRVRISE